LAMEMLMSTAGIEMVHIPYKGGAPSVVGLVSGEVQSLFTSIPTALPQVNAGKMRALGVSISKRSSALPNVPTIAESLPGYYAASWYGLMLPAGVPKPVAIPPPNSRNSSAKKSRAGIKSLKLRASNPNNKPKRNLPRIK
jgi:tripartite-type tricarboxylate transporter receptor subunit TctC